MTQQATDPKLLPAPLAVPDKPDNPGQGDVVRRDLLLKLAEASLLITQNLNLDTILQGVIDGARSLTSARYGALLSFDRSGHIRDLIISGITPEEVARMDHTPEGQGLLAYMNEIHEPLRLKDIASHPMSVGFPKNHPPMRTFLGTPVLYHGTVIANIYLTEKEGGQEFTQEDEDILGMFASQAAMAISNARMFRDEQQAMANLEAVLDTSPVGIIIFDAKTGAALSVNDEVRRIAGPVRGQGRSLERLLELITFRRPDGREIPLEELPLTRALTTRATVRAEEIVLHFRGGHKVPVIVNSQPIYSPDGEIVSVVATLQDLTLAEESTRRRTDFLGTVSQALRSPMTTIKGASATALSPTFPVETDEMRQFFRIIDEQVDHMRNLMTDLADVAHIEGGTLPLSPEPTDAAALIEQAKATFLQGQSSTVIEADLAPELPRILADQRRVVQVLTNLFASSSRRSPNASSIKVTAWPDDQHLVISVSSEGEGVSPRYLPLLFDKYSHYSAEGNDRAAGHEGLAFAVCKGIVEAHGGRMWVESAGGPDVKFIFTVPLTVDPTAGYLAPGPDNFQQDPESGQGPTRILLADSDPYMQRHVRNALREAGYASIVAGDANEAIRIAWSERPHLVLLDMTLPSADTFDIIERILEIGEIPIICLSGRHVDQDMSQAFEAGADDYIIKPFSPTELMVRIKTALGRKAASRTVEFRPYYELDDVKIDYAERVVTVAGRPAKLTATEYSLLFVLSTNAGRVVTQERLLDQVWGPDSEAYSASLRSYVKRLRTKLGDDAKHPKYILTEPRIGYRMAMPGEKRQARRANGRSNRHR